MVCVVCSAARLSTPAPPEPLPHLYDSANQLRKILDETGWLHHYTTPDEVVQTHGHNPEELRHEMLIHYRDNWTDIRAEIESRLLDYDIDPESKATFREALSAHEAGLYRCVPRVLFGEIERVLRIEMLENVYDRVGVKQIYRQLLEGESCLNKGATLADFLPNGFLDGIIFNRVMQGLGLTGREAQGKELLRGLYADVFTEEALNQTERDPVPNRHAAMHGLVVYSTPVNSLNMLFLTDYFFQLVSNLKRRVTQTTT